MSGVTVQGTTSSSPVTHTYNNTQNQALAQQISNAIAQANNDGTLFVQNYSADHGTLPTVPAGKVGELIIDGTGGYNDVTVPASYSYVVTNNTASTPITVHGSPNTSIFGGGNSVTVIDPAAITLGDTSSGSTNVIALTPADAPYNAAVGNGHNTVYAGGSGTVSGGTGTNQLNAGSGTGSNLLISQGVNDTIVAGLSGATTSIEASGTGALIFANAGTALMTLSGANATVANGSGADTIQLGTGATGTTVFGGTGTMNVSNLGGTATIAGSTGTVSLSGSSGSLLFDGFGGNGTVVDAGTADTIVAGNSTTNITSSSASLVYGTTGTLNFAGGAFAATVVAGSGNTSVLGGSGGVVYGASGTTSQTVTAGTGGATLFGASGGEINVNGSGKVLFVGEAGSETLNGASQSGAINAYAGSGNDSLVGGSGNDTLIAGAGSDTLTGNAGNNLFGFIDGNAGGTYTISDFNSSDTVFLVGYGTAAAANAISSATSAGGNTTLHLADNSTITFTGVASASDLQGHIGSNALA